MSRLSILIDYPWLAFVPALIFFCLFYVFRRRFSLFAGCAWSIYILYEFGMKLRVFCSNECNIRVDLLLLWPFLLIVSVVALINLFSGSSPPGSG